MRDICGRTGCMADETNLPAKLEPGDLVPASPGRARPGADRGCRRRGQLALHRFHSPPTSRNPNTRRAYVRACKQFFAWCDERGRSLVTVRPFDVATYIEGRQQTHSAPDVKQQLAAVRMLFDWLVTGQVVPTNPAAARARPQACGEDWKDPGAGSR